MRIALAAAAPSVLGLALLMGAAPAPAADENPLKALDAEQTRTLKSGQVVTEFVVEKTAEGFDQGRVRGYIVINRPFRDVWSQISNFNRQWEFMPRVKLTKVTRSEDEGRRAWVFHHLEVIIVDVIYTLEETVDEARRRIEFALDKSVQHDVREVRGHWQFVPVDRGRRTVAAFTTFVDSGRFVPQFIQNWLVQRDLPEMLENLRRRVESGGAWRKDD